jgi:catechol 2,3-dioxygenase-like lactoylglutathione lyase family enzyme
MLGHRNAIPSLAVKDVAKARRFYETVIGATPVDNEGDEVVTYKSGETLFTVYRSAYAGTNQATALTWSVGKELDSLMDSLRAKGVRFEHYDLPGTRRDGDVHSAGAVRVAWFKDPDGNILSLIDQ